MLKDALDEGIDLEWVDVADIPMDVMTVTPYWMGSIAPISSETQAEIDSQDLVNKYGDRSMEEAVKELENYIGEPIGCIVAAELGAGNTPGQALLRQTWLGSFYCKFHSQFSIKPR